MTHDPRFRHERVATLALVAAASAHENVRHGALFVSWLTLGIDDIGMQLEQPFTVEWGGRFARAEDGRFQRRQTYEGEEGRPPARRGALQTKTSLTRRAQSSRAGRAFDAETASIDSASFVRDFNRRGEE